MKEKEVCSRNACVCPSAGRSTIETELLLLPRQKENPSRLTSTQKTSVDATSCHLQKPRIIISKERQVVPCHLRIIFCVSVLRCCSVQIFVRKRFLGLLMLRSKSIPRHVVLKGYVQACRPVVLASVTLRLASHLSALSSFRCPCII